MAKRSSVADLRFLPGARWRMRRCPESPGVVGVCPGWITVLGPAKRARDSVLARYVPDDVDEWCSDERRLQGSSWGSVEPWVRRHLELLADPVEETADQRVQNIMEVHLIGQYPPPKGVRCDCHRCESLKKRRRTK